MSIIGRATWRILYSIYYNCVIRVTRDYGDCQMKESSVVHRTIAFTVDGNFNKVRNKIHVNSSPRRNSSPRDFTISNGRRFNCHELSDP